MRKIIKSLTNISSDEDLFKAITDSFTDKIIGWSYFVNWEKALENIGDIERELNLLNTLIGKEHIKNELISLIAEYPQVIKTFPILLAMREKSIEVLIDLENNIYKNFDFQDTHLDSKKIIDLVDFLCRAGFLGIVQNKQLKSFVDYVLGVEVGLDSNGRKNRTGQLMERIVEDFLKSMKIDYISQATVKKIYEKWNIEVISDKVKRIIDFVIFHNQKLFFIEVNFYGGVGSKLKSTAREYIDMNSFWNTQGISFIWITDGAGWKKTINSLREYFNASDYLLNLDMLRKGILEKIIYYE